jgi:hypothetical protein
MQKRNLELITITTKFNASFIKLAESNVRLMKTYNDGTKEYSLCYENAQQICFSTANTKWQCVLGFCKRLMQIDNQAFTNEINASFQKAIAK